MVRTAEKIIKEKTGRDHAVNTCLVMHTSNDRVLGFTTEPEEHDKNGEGC